MVQKMQKNIYKRGSLIDIYATKCILDLQLIMRV